MKFKFKLRRKHATGSTTSTLTIGMKPGGTLQEAVSYARTLVKDSEILTVNGLPFAEIEALIAPGAGK